MANLIPPDAKKHVLIEYWIRVASVWMLLAAGCFLVFAILSIPQYVVVSSQLKVLEVEEAAMQEAGAGEYTIAVAAIDRANDLAKQLNKKSTLIPATELLGAVEAAQGSGVTLRTYSYSPKDGVVSEIRVRGSAVDRTSLANFQNALEDSPKFLSAKVPVSNLLRDKNLTFDITVDVNTAR